MLLVDKMKILGINETVILEYLQEQIDQHTSKIHYFDDRYWFLASRDEVMEDLSLWSEGTVYRIFRQMAQRNLLFKQPMSIIMHGQSIPVNAYAINQETIDKLLRRVK